MCEPKDKSPAARASKIDKSQLGESDEDDAEPYDPLANLKGFIESDESSEEEGRRAKKKRQRRAEVESSDEE